MGAGNPNLFLHEINISVCGHFGLLAIALKLRLKPSTQQTGEEGKERGKGRARRGEEGTFTISSFFYDVNVAAGGHLGRAHVVSFRVILLGLFYPLIRDRDVVLKRR